MPYCLALASLVSCSHQISHLPCFQVLQQHEQGSQLSEPPMAAAQAVWAAAALSQPGAIQAAGELGYARLQALLQARVGRKLHHGRLLLTVGWHSHDLR